MNCHSSSTHNWVLEMMFLETLTSFQMQCLLCSPYLETGKRPVYGNRKQIIKLKYIHNIFFNNGQKKIVLSKIIISNYLLDSIRAKRLADFGEKMCVIDKCCLLVC